MRKKCLFLDIKYYFNIFSEIDKIPLMLFLEKQIHVLKSADSAFAEQIKSIFIETTYLKEIKISGKKK